MTVTSVTQQIATALLDQIGAALVPIVDDLQVIPAGRFSWIPTPPCIDVMPAEEFQVQERFGVSNDVIIFTLRARANTPDHDGAQDLMLALMCPWSDTSVQRAVSADRTLGGAVHDAVVTEGPTGYGVYPSMDPSVSGYLGCTWTVRVER